MKLYDLTDTHLAPSTSTRFGLIGFACDEGIRRNLGRVGAAKGPAAIREALAKLPLQTDIECYDAGDITCIDEDLEASQLALAHAITELLQHNITPIVLGGGHELAFGHYQGIVHAYPKEALSIMNFDAHFDMRPLLSENKGSSGTGFLQIAFAEKIRQQIFDYNCLGIQPASNISLLFDTAKEHQVKTLLAEEIIHDENNKVQTFMDHLLQENKIIYMSICLDVFAASYAPGVSAPQVFGLTPWHLIPWIRELAKSGQVISYDLAELSPTYDIDQRTAKLAAHLIFEIIHHHKGRQYAGK